MPAYLDRLRLYYGETGLSGSRYDDLMGNILARQSEMISNRLGQVQKRKLDQHAERALKFTGRSLQVPDLSEVLPAKSVHIRKAAERGKMLNDRLRIELSKNLRNAVSQYMAEGQPTMQYQRGEARGRIKPQLIDSFEKTIRSTFQDYSRRGEGGVPANIRTIATTEIMGAVNEIKYGYMERLAERNPDGIEIRKRWKHHPERSKELRPGHERMNEKTVLISAPFMVPVYKRIGTVKTGPKTGHPRWARVEPPVPMNHPCDPSAPISEIASCHCECDYLIVVKAEMAGSKSK